MLFSKLELKVVLLVLVKVVKCVIGYDNLAVTPAEEEKPELDPDVYVINLDRDEINMTSMTKKIYHESKMMDYFADYIELYGKEYTIPEIVNYHYSVFADNVRYINKLNERFKGITVYKINKYTDTSFENFTKWNLGFDLEESKNVKGLSYPTALWVLDNQWDAVQNLTHLVRNLDGIKAYHEKDQGNCSIAYVFSAVRQLELGYRLQVDDYENQMILSDQHAFDCTPVGDCNGKASSGHVYKALENTGIHMAKDYPLYDMYNPKKGPCRYDRNKFTVRWKQLRHIHLFHKMNEDRARGLLWNRAAFTTSMYVPRAMQHYKAGVLIPTECVNQTSNHMIVLSGFGETTNGVKYWVGHNSWGVSWGEYGRFKLLRGLYACKIISEYLAYGLIFYDEFPPFEGGVPGIDDNQKTEEPHTTRDFGYDTKLTQPGSTTEAISIVPYWSTTPEKFYTVNRSLIASSTTERPDYVETPVVVPPYHVPRAKKYLESNKYIAKAFENWYKSKAQLAKTPPMEVLDDEYLRTSTVLTTPASWKEAPKVDYGEIEQPKESDSFYVP